MNEQSQTIALIVFAILGLPGVFLISWMLGSVRRTGGQVGTHRLGLADLLLSFFLCGFFAMMVLGAGQAKTKAAATNDATPITVPELVQMPDSPAEVEAEDDSAFGDLPAKDEQDEKSTADAKDGSAKKTASKVGEVSTKVLLANVTFFLLLVGIILGLLAANRVPLREFFGFGALPPSSAFLRGILIVMAILPIISLIGLAIQALMQGAAQEQELVTAFREAAKSGKQESIWMMALVAVIFQPVVEEVIFRGYIYPTFKGWAGPLASAVATSLLFAAVHANVPAILPLLFLALVLTLAYEWSGSILVPIAMHMAFNGSQLLLLQWMAENGAN